jgi:formate/nitrite transporter FocA (FNT family)
MMKNLLTRFRQAGSFIAGLLIGLSIVVAVSAMMIVEPSDWRTLWIFGAPVIFALGFALQLVVTTKPGHRAYDRPGAWSLAHPTHAVDP